MLSRLGIIIFILGLTMGDSEWILVPIAMLALGAALCRIGYLKGDQIWIYEEEDINE